VAWPGGLREGSKRGPARRGRCWKSRETQKVGSGPLEHWGTLWFPQRSWSTGRGECGAFEPLERGAKSAHVAALWKQELAGKKMKSLGGVVKNLKEHGGGGGRVIID